MTDDDTDTDEPQSGMERLLSRFGPVPERDPNRPAPGPRPDGTGLERPRPGPRPQREVVMAGAPAATDPSPLFDEPHDDVFGSPPPETDWVEAEAYAVEDADYVEPYEVIDRRDWVRVPRRSGPVFRFLIVAFIVGIGVTTVYSRVTTWFDDQIDPPGPPQDTVEFTIDSGETANDVTQTLFSNGVIANPTIFRYWLSDNFDGDFQAGDYSCVRQNMSFDEVIACLDGEGPLPAEFFTITIPEGQRLTDMLDTLVRENPSLNRADLLRDLNATLVSVGIEGVPDAPLASSPDPTGSGKEGLLFPATYQIDERKRGDALDILRRMADTMELTWESAVADEGHDPIIDELDLNDYQVLTIASLIEAEARTAADRPKIARVIYNRLLNGWSLGIDATSCYAANKPCADLTQEDLDSPSPWNTRNAANRRLPPTPIASPGEASIRAALAPESGEWMYYVLADAEGNHTFAVTDAEFAEAKRLCQERGLC
ncbi:MAG: endolytic transglycosylase MltG [Acidimicrobiales bacterium]